jgi:hypothetical protein
MPLRESRKDDPAGHFDHSKGHVSLLSPQGLNISDRKRLLSVRYPTLARIATSIRGHPRTAVFGSHTGTTGTPMEFVPGRIEIPPVERHPIFAAETRSAVFLQRKRIEAIADSLCVG